MKNKYSALFKAGKFRLNQKRRKMATLEELRDELRRSHESIDQNLSAERMNFDQNAVREAETIFVEYATKRRENIAKSLERLDMSIENEKTELADAFRNFKEIEIISTRPRESRTSVKAADADRFAPYFTSGRHAVAAIWDKDREKNH